MTDDRPADDDEYWQRVRDADDVTEPAGHEGSNVKTDPDEVRGWAEQRDAVPAVDPNASGPGAYALRHENVVDGSAHERVTWEDFVASFRGEDMAFHHADEDDEAGTHRFVHRSDVEEHLGDERTETDADRGVAGTAEDESRSDERRADADRSEEAQPDIGAAETESDSTDAATDRSEETQPDIGAAETGSIPTETAADRSDESQSDLGTAETGSVPTETATDRDADEGTVVGDREGGVESGTDAETGRAETESGRTGTETGAERTETDAGRADTGAETSSDTDVLADVSEGDSVVDDRGETVGLVTAVESGTLYVDPDPGLTEKLSAKLGWVDRDDAEYTVDASDVASVEGGDVRLRR